jgi:radical SAM superfamily enzyme YgiQ (UPF0313 family)
LKVKDIIGELPGLIARIRKTGLTFAPEVGSERLRKIIGKNIRPGDVEECVVSAFKAGWKRVKLYFMIGLPTETRRDLEEMVEFIYRISLAGKSYLKRPAELTVSVTSLVPKPHTPFQWEPMAEMDTLYKSQAFLKSRLKNRYIKLNLHDPRLNFLEALLSRGDRRIGEVILSGWRKGCQFDGWKEHFSFGKWQEALKECNINPEFYITRTRDYQEIFPWDHIAPGVSKESLVTEAQRAKQQI